MYVNDVVRLNELANEKETLASNNPIKFMLRAMMAGFYLIVAIILSYSIGALTQRISPELSKILTAMTFSIALALISFLGGELFTGNNLVMGISFFDKKTKILGLLKVWTLSYLGNLIGSIIIGFIFIKSGSGKEIFPEYLATIVNTKVSMTVVELLFKGILCNFIVCIAVMCSVKMESEIGKMVAMFWLIFAFVLAGFEHSIANMGIFTLSYFTLGSLPWGGVLFNMFWVTIGNIIGGTILYGGTLYLMKVEK
ncbi:formate/nitrite transporter family protein [Clostridium sp. LP20]|uniref:formate/nitrite transporter family protein n=1 Tax=Clostridium sp. LP20 TaxID=3418665 RepID=UPI003EE812CA